MLDELIDVLHDLSGSIFRRAELSDDFKETYSQVFEKIMEIESAGKNILEVFGNMGG
jgi:hypothetical protein